MALSARRLKEVASGGAASVIVSAGATNVVRLASNLTLTRLVAPEAFAVTAIVMSINITISLLADVGIYDFIIQHKDGDDPTFRDEVWSIRLLRGIVLAAVTALLAFPVAAMLHKPIIGPVIAVYSLSFVLDGLSSLAWATGVREHRFWQLTWYEFGANLIGTLASIVLAFLYHSYWALVAGMGVSSVMQVILSYAMFPPAARRWRFRPERAREIWVFSRYIAAASALTLLLMQADKLILARLMPLAMFGLYGVASQLAAAPSALALSYTSRVLLATYAQTAREDIANMRAIFYARRRKVALLYMAAIGFGIAAAPLIIHVLYRPNYYAVAPFFQLLLISVALRFSTQSAKWALIAIGQTRTGFYSQLLSVAWLAIGTLVSIASHNVMMLVAVVGTVELPTLLCSWWYLRRDGLLDLRAEVIELAAGGAGLAIGWLVSDVGLRLWPNL